jgi:hypothetical protein
MNIATKKFSVAVWRPLAVRASAGVAGRGVRLLLGLAVLLAIPCGLAQEPGSQQSNTSKISDHPFRMYNENFDPSSSVSMNDPAFQQRRLSQLKQAKYKSIVSNTEKLQKLVADLNAEIGAANQTSLTPDQLRKVAAIEKLARSVKDDMRSPVQETPVFMGPAHAIGDSTRR